MAISAQPAPIVFVFSEASATGAAQSGQNFAQVTFAGNFADGTIPLPATPLLVLGGLAVMARRRQ